MALDTMDKPNPADTPAGGDTVDTAAEEAKSTLQRLRGQADDAVSRLNEKLKPPLDAVTGYVRDEPTKGMLASAAVGAGLMALVVLATRTSAKPSVRSPALRSIRDAALDLADRAHLAANGALAAAQTRTRGLFSTAQGRADSAFDAAQQRSNDAHAAARQRAASAAVAAQGMADDAIGAARAKAADASDAASAAAADAWQSLRDYADPVVDSLRPQFEAAARYARDEPARAAIGVATAGAVLIGLLTLLRSRD